MWGESSAPSADRPAGGPAGIELGRALPAFCTIQVAGFWGPCLLEADWCQEKTDQGCLGREGGRVGEGRESCPQGTGAVKGPQDEPRHEVGAPALLCSISRVPPERLGGQDNFILENIWLIFLS